MSAGPYLIVYAARASSELFCFWAGTEGEAREKLAAIVVDGATSIYLDGEDARDVPVSYVALVRVMTDYDFSMGMARSHPEGSDGEAA